MAFAKKHSLLQLLSYNIAHNIQPHSSLHVFFVVNPQSNMSGVSATSSMISQAVQATAVLSVVLWFKVFATNIGLGGAKNNAGTRPPEDTYQKNVAEATEADKTNLDRAQRIVNNDLENIPYTMVLAWGSIYCIGMAGASGGSSVDSHATAHIVLYTIFVVSRYAHSIVYISGMSTARSIAWLFGALCSFGIAINGAIVSFK